MNGQGMVIVKDISLAIVPRNPWKIFDHPRVDLNIERLSDGAVMDMKTGITSEMIEGEIFTNKRGERFCIGMSKDVQNAIGLPFECFKNLTQQNNRMQQVISDFGTMTVWQRLRFFFTGKAER